MSVWINCIKKKWKANNQVFIHYINFYLSDEYNIQTDRKETIGWGESMINLFDGVNKEIVKLWVI